MCALPTQFVAEIMKQGFPWTCDTNQQDKVNINKNDCEHVSTQSIKIVVLSRTLQHVAENMHSLNSFDNFLLFQVYNSWLIIKKGLCVHPPTPQHTKHVEKTVWGITFSETFQGKVNPAAKCFNNDGCNKGFYPSGRNQDTRNNFNSSCVSQSC